MRHNKFLPVIYFTTVFLVFAFFSSCSKERNYLPSAFSGASLKEKISGKEALSRLNKIHFNPVAAGKENDIGYYEKEGNNSTIYITYYKTGGEALTDFEKMTLKITPGNSQFFAPDTFELEGRKIYRCFGMGQTHFVFTHNNVLIWISTGTISSSDFLKDYIKQIN